MWCVPVLDDEYVERMEDILELYERPYNPAEPVVCLDERPVQLHGDARPRSPAKPGREARFDYEYVRKGTANIFCAVEPLAGRHMARATPTRNHREFAKMVAAISRSYPDARTIHLVIDNLSTHSLKSLVRFYGLQEGTLLWERFTVHFTPKHGSWLNMAEIEIGVVNRECIGTLRFSTLRDLRDHLRPWSRDANRHATKIQWRFTRRKARKKFGYKPTRTKRSEH